jgi:hypothetical protein
MAIKVSDRDRHFRDLKAQAGACCQQFAIKLKATSGQAGQQYLSGLRAKAF